MSETMSGSKLDSLSLISWSTLKVALLCFQTRKEGKSNFTVVGGWKWKQQFQSGVSQLRMLRLDLEPKVGQSFLPESCSHCPIWCKGCQSLLVKVWNWLAHCAFCPQMDFWSTQSLCLILGNIFPAANGGLADVAWRMQLCSYPCPLQQWGENQQMWENCRILRSRRPSHNSIFMRVTLILSLKLKMVTSSLAAPHSKYWERWKHQPSMPTLRATGNHTVIQFIAVVH